MHRRDHMPLSDAPAIYEVLFRLEIGDTVPPEIYVRDYETGVIPAWVVYEKSVSGPVTDLVLVDETVGNCLVAMVVLTCQGKTLGGQLFQYVKDGGQARNKFGDIRQDARQIAEKMRDGLPPHVVAHNYRKEQIELERWLKGEPLTKKEVLPTSNLKRVKSSQIVQTSLFEEAGKL